MEFPKFKSIELSDKQEVEKITFRFPPYSDFNFSNLLAWDLKREMGFSILNNNLVVKFTDYVNGQPFLSFLGDNMVNETARELIITPGLMIWDGITNVLNHDETPEFNFKGGLEVLMRGLIFKCQSVVSHVVTDQTTYTTIDGAMDVVESSLNYE